MSVFAWASCCFSVSHVILRLPSFTVNTLISRLIPSFIFTEFISAGAHWRTDSAKVLNSHCEGFTVMWPSDALTMFKSALFCSRGQWISGKGTPWLTHTSEQILWQRACRAVQSPSMSFMKHYQHKMWNVTALTANLQSHGITVTFFPNVASHMISAWWSSGTGV